ncbi:YlmH/Sll1252 family protein [Paenibacillus polysaccharolyticus]|uniref:RNA-binding protein n=1 Tax=Paenibacillus cucumis (ex Kampfer et al. 2016) TaxID=1776858 RepID=A0ABS7KJS8_9BACL|nr:MULTISPECIES: YlmH/Sll1252 family protein [Paenibacillus]MBY0204379.1 RNA-binding protein [Paenibacillus cucumis (ex Kampfer et al. 2016)]MCP1132706.1 YlmH/Sll1252 family protein [Paenibacillus polysaccharolyticus]MDP9699450.1 RNA-binding protein YlmH [Paenibacillus intestini]
MSGDMYEHFSHDERDFVDKANDWVERASKVHDMKLTDFLDPRQVFILQSLVNRSQDVQVRFDGGYEAAERKRALIAPDYRYLDEEDMGMQVLSITSDDQKISELEHGDYMGSLLGLGMKRGKIGDIQVLEDGCHTVVAAETGAFLSLQLNQVHRLHVFTELLPLNQMKWSATKLDTIDITVASMRLDGICADVHRLSRSKILIPIKAGRCKVNWKVVEDPSKPLKAGDVVSIQGFGRFKVLEQEGMTKKGRCRVKIGKFA